MNKYKFIITLLMSLVFVSMGYCQENLENHQVKTVKGAVVNADTIGSIISIRTDGQHQMSFFVPEKAIITQETHNIGLMDIGKSSFVTIQYFVAPALKNTVISIVDNESIVNE